MCRPPPYLGFLVACFALFGPGVLAPRLVQVTAGALVPVLLYAIGARVFGARAGLVSGWIAALLRPLRVL